LFICLFLRKISAGVAKKGLRQTTDDVRVTDAGARKNKRGLQAKHLPLPEQEGTKVVSQPDRSIESPQRMGVLPNSTTVLMEGACICSKKK
jgi:hypothetical protein